MDGTKLVAKAVADLRLRAQTDLYWLASEILGYDLVPHVHKPICEAFVQKNPQRALFDQDMVKQRLILDPRGHFKTTLDIADCIQWILCFPNVRILIMTGTLPLAKRMMQECKAHFQFNTKLRALFPEYCPEDTDDFGTNDSFTSPARTNWKLREPTVSVSTIESVKAGSHYDIIKCDDLVNELNVETREQLEKTVRAFHYTTPILEPGGYRDVIGTRYAFDDLYGLILDSNSPLWRIHVRPAWTVLPTTEGGEEYTILFPERFKLEELKDIQREDPYLFNCQYLNHPIPGEKQQFPPDLLTSHIIPWTQIPSKLRLYIMWDLGFSQKHYADWSVGAVGGFDDQGRLFILQLVRGRFMPHELVNAIATATIRYKPLTNGIEAAGGSALLGPALNYKARELRRYIPVDWVKTNPKKTKVERISALESLMRQDKLYISNAVNHKDALIEEFTRFPKFSHDDIPDAIAMLAENYIQHQTLEWPDRMVEQTAWLGGAPELGGLVG